jgi:tetrahydromethanopterin S-methyltransferase subunit B
MLDIVSAMITDTVQDQVIDSMKNAHEAVIDAVRFGADNLSALLPLTPKLPFADQLPDPAALATNAVEFADKLYGLQKAFVVELIDAARPVLAPTGADDA